MAPTARAELNVAGFAMLLPVVDRSPNTLSKKYPWESRKFGPPKENWADFDAEGLVEQVRHRPADGLVIEEVGHVLGRVVGLVHRMGDHRDERGSGGQFTGDPE